MKTASPMLTSARAGAKAAAASLAIQSNDEPAAIALSRLTTDWQPLAAIKLSAESGIRGFGELVLAGKAQARFDRNGKPGHRVFYRLMPEGGASLTPRAQRRHARKAAA
jgi:hypothetical protein